MILADGATSHTMLMTMATAVAAGALLIVASRRLNIPAIVLLLIGGVLLGPTVWGEAAPVRPEDLGEGLRVVVALSVGLILFEGGLTLDVTGYQSAPRMIKRLLTVGVFITWFGTALALKFIVPSTAWDVAILSGSLVIVTGPTVIAPLLKRIKITSRLHNILHWEGVLIDPIGVFVALLCYEWIIGRSGQEASLNLAFRVASGLMIGIPGGWLLSFIIRRRIVPEETINVFALGFAVLVFGAAESIRSEAGLLSVTVAGFVFGLTGPARMKQVRQFKAEITDLLIGTLFILLAARLEIQQFLDFGVQGMAVVAVVIFLIRPLSILICSTGLDLRVSEKIFLSWISPRGIVAASMASLFAISMAADQRFINPRIVETFTYSVIVTTIVLQGSTAGLLAAFLRLKRPEPTGWLIVGAHAFGRRIAEFISRTAGREVKLIDSSARIIRRAEAEGLTVVNADARDVSLADRGDFQGIGNVLALTDNDDLNARVCHNWGEVLGWSHVFRCNPTNIDIPETEDELERSGRVIWQTLPRPSLLSREMEQGEAEVFVVSDGEEPIPDTASPIIMYQKNRLVFDPPRASADEEAAESDGKTLCVRRRADYLLRAIRPELITTLEVAELRELLEKLVDRVVSVEPSLPRDEMVEELLERESAFPTVLGHGVAVPHAFSGEIDTRVCAVAQIPGGVAFGEREDDKVSLVFLLLSPKGDPQGHLATLADIARLVIQENVREQLMAAETPLDVVRIIRESVEG